jgi:hypothetical protein
VVGLGRYALKGPFHAATVAGVLAVLSLFIPLVSVLSGAIIGLVILTQGSRSGLWVIFVSVVGITLVTYLTNRPPVYGVAIGLVQWLPMVMLAEVLRRTASFSFTLLVGAGLALLAVVVQFLVWPQSSEMWTQFMSQLLQGVEQQQDAATLGQLEQAMRNIAYWMNIMVVAVMYSTFVATLMLSRWFQARLAQNQYHRDEFYAIKLGRSAAGLALVLMALAAMMQLEILIALAMVLVAAFVFQGLAVVHKAARMRKAKMWLFVLYAMMIFVPQVVALVALLGIVDNWVDFRARLRGQPEQTD